MRQNIKSYEVIVLVANIAVGLFIAKIGGVIGIDGWYVACGWFFGLYLGTVITKG